MSRVVVDGELQFSSVSQIARFDSEQDGGCPAKWYGKYVMGWPEPQTKAQDTGVNVHARLEHWGKTGEDVLGPIERAGIHLMLQPGEGLNVEWGLNDRSRPVDEFGKQVNYFPPEESLLFADGVPLIGFMDRVNIRGEYVNVDGQLVEELGVVEIEDIKTSGNARKWAKAPEQLLETPQMTGYGAWAAAKYPWLKGIRLSHTTFDVGVRYATKSTVLVSVEKAIELWHKHGHIPVRKMREVARLKSFDDVPKNTAACSQFGGCPYISRCFKTTLDRLRAAKGNMGLLEKAKKSLDNGTPPAAAQAPVGAPPSVTAPSVTAPSVTAPSVTAPSVTAPSVTTPVTPIPPNGIGIDKCEMGEFYVIDAAGTLGEFTGTSRGIGFFQTNRGTVKLLASGTVAPKPKPPPQVEEKGVKPKRNGRMKIKDETQSATEIRLFIGCAPSCAYKWLDEYVAQIAEGLAERYDVLDIRLSPNSDHELAFSRWKGAVAAEVRKSPPPPGDYAIGSFAGDIASEVVSALIPLCTLVVR